MNRTSFLAMFLLVTITRTAPAEPTFAKPPQVTRAGDQVSVSFAVSESTDVEVAVLDAKGKIVRHLAAGVLGGKNPPPRPLAASLEQRITWDGKDDLGKPAAGGPFQVRVRAGTSVHFGKLIGSSPYTGSVASMPYRAPVNGVGTDADGNVFVMMMSSVGSHGNSGMWPWHLRKFDREGKYLQTMLPYPASTDAAKASGYSLVGTADKAFTPANQSSLYP